MLLNYRELEILAADKYPNRADLAKAMGISQPYLSEIFTKIRNREEINVSITNRFCLAFGVSARQITIVDEKQDCDGGSEGAAA